MKKYIITLCLAMLLLLCACTAHDANPEASTPSTAEQNAAVETEAAYLFENSEENAICAAYPKLCSPESDAANDTIYNFVQEKIAAICILTDYNLTASSEKPSETAEDYQNTYLNVEYRITYCTDDLVSIVFEGLYNYKKAAHPIHLLFTLNIDPQSGKEIAFADRYAIDDALYEAFAAQAEKDITEGAGGTWPEGWGTFSDAICSKAAFLNGLSSGDDFHVFYTAEGVGISYPVPYAMGDHLEVMLPYSALNALK